MVFVGVQSIMFFCMKNFNFISFPLPNYFLKSILFKGYIYTQRKLGQGYTYIVLMPHSNNKCMICRLSHMHKQPMSGHASRCKCVIEYVQAGYVHYHMQPRSGDAKPIFSRFVVAFLPAEEGTVLMCHCVMKYVFSSNKVNFDASILSL